MLSIYSFGKITCINCNYLIYNKDGVINSMDLFVLIILFLGIVLFLIIFPLMIKISFPNCFNGLMLDTDLFIREIKKKLTFFISVTFIFFLWSLCIVGGMISFYFYPLIQMWFYDNMILTCLFIISPYLIILMILKKK